MESTVMLSMELQEAARRGDISEVARMLEAGADPNFRDVLHGSTCLHSVAARGGLPIVELLLQGGADPNISTQNTSASPLGVAALSGETDTVQLLIASGARLSNHELKTGLLQECRRTGYVEIASMIESGPGFQEIH